MIKVDYYVNRITLNKSKTKHNKNWSHIPDHPYRILILEVQDLEKQIYN